MKVLAIIPARGGSKGIPNKNIAILDGKPLISYTIEAALASTELDEIVVSSDSEEILKVASQYKTIVQHDRDKSIAGDKSPVSATIDSILSSRDGFDYVMLLQPTSPIRTGKQIDEAIQLLHQNEECNSLISVVPMDDVHPARMYWKNDLQLSSILSEYEEVRRQDIPTAFYRNGSIYLVRVDAFKLRKNVMLKPAIGYDMPYNWLLNIDEPRDLIIGDALMKAWKKGEL